jgi:hypothetical protein
MIASSSVADVTLLRLLVVSVAVSVEVSAAGTTVASVVVVEASVVVVDAGGSAISVPPLPSLVRLKFAVV